MKKKKNVLCVVHSCKTSMTNIIQLCLLILHKRNIGQHEHIKGHIVVEHNILTQPCQTIN